MQLFDRQSFQELCTRLVLLDENLKRVVSTYGPPPLWIRPNSFATLVLTILEQQVSLASAFAAYKRLKEKVKIISPQTILSLSEDDLRSCSFSRQKIVYVQELAKAITTRQISLRKFQYQCDEEVRQQLKKLKGIGDWTVDIYLIHALRRTDIFPVGDLALVNALKEVKSLPPHTTKDELLHLSLQWKPYRSIATMILWHYYIQKRKIKTLM